MLVARTLAVCAVLGFGAGWIIPFIGIPFLACFVCYFLGLFSGRWLAKIIDHKLGNNITKVIVFGLLIGMSLSPFGALPLMMAHILSQSIMSGTGFFDALSFIASSLFCPVCFIIGVLRPTVWGERW